MEQRAYSENTAQAMDEEAKKLVDEAYQRTLLLLNEKKVQIKDIAELLLKVRIVARTPPSLPPSPSLLLHKTSMHEMAPPFLLLGMVLPVFLGVQGGIRAFFPPPSVKPN